MLTEKQIKEIREHLARAQNPLFFFDNDDDGLCSFLILQRFIGRGKGVAIKSFPDLNESYYRKVNELKPDYIFILDKPVVSEAFLKKAEEENIPVVWIDHHEVEEPCMKTRVSLTSPISLFSYYNPYNNDKSHEPVSYLCYKIVNEKKDIWLSIIGCISDCYLPNFYSEFEKKYPDLAKKNPKSAFELLYDSEIGRIARILDFSLKDTTTNVVKMMKFMMKVKGALDILEENSKTKQILKRYEEVNSKYQELVKKAREQAGNKMVYFQYGGSLSLSSNLANQISYEFPDKVVVMVYLKGDVANISVRGKGDILKLTLKAIEGIEGATGGGHKHATGAKMNVSDLPVFRKRVEEFVR